MQIGLNEINENNFKNTKVVKENGQDFCYQCHLQVVTQTILRSHKEVVHEGVKYFGDQCNYQS